jgi:hypothetical protein
MDPIIRGSVLEMLAKKEMKPNKLRKLVFNDRFTKKHPELAWTDFANTLSAMTEEGVILLERQADLSEVCVLASTHQGQKSSTANKRSLNDGDAPAAKMAGKAKKAKVDSNGTLDDSQEEDAGSGPEEESLIQKKMEVPERFIPFLLRQSGQKLKNIEVNTKTHIQCAPKKNATSSKGPWGGESADSDEGEASEDHVDTEDETRALTITGRENKHVKAAKILIEAMLQAFIRNNKAGIGPGNEGSAGKGGKGKGVKGGKGSGGKGGKGKDKGGKGGKGKGKGKGGKGDGGGKGGG